MKQKLRDMKIKTSIILAVGMILVIMVFMSGISLHYAGVLSEQTETLYAKPHTNLVRMWQVKEQIAETGSLLKDACVAHTKVDSQVAGMADGVYDLIVVIESNKVNKGGVTDQMQVVMDSADAWRNRVKAVVEAVNGGAVPTTEQYQSYQELEKAAIASVDAIIATASENAVKFKDNSVRISRGVDISLILTCVVAVLLAVIILTIIVKKITNPINEILRVSDEMSQGNLHSEIRYVSNNEFGMIISAFSVMQEYLREVITDIDHCLQEMSDGNLVFETKMDYIGDFHSIREGMLHIRQSLTYALRNIYTASDEVSSGADQVSAGAQALSQGTTEQASSIEELSVTISDISKQITENAANAGRADEVSRQAGDEMERGNAQMQKMMDAMNAIAENSSQISKVIKAIDDIAFQTNILALNAAVEAARAGAAGKGFAVVADEVRNLAGKSAESVKETTALIQNAVEAVDNGNSIAKATAESMDRVVQSTDEMVLLIDKIAKASKEQAEAVSQVSIGIDQINSVVQTNSATAEESAASAEELSSQAGIMKGLVEKFRF